MPSLKLWVINSKQGEQQATINHLQLGRCEEVQFHMAEKVYGFTPNIPSLFSNIKKNPLMLEDDLNSDGRSHGSLSSGNMRFHVGQQTYTKVEQF